MQEFAEKVYLLPVNNESKVIEACFNVNFSRLGELEWF
jgi:hypothetical protein